MLRVKKQCSYWYLVLQDDVLVAHLFKGGDGRWRIFTPKLYFDERFADYKDYDLALDEFIKHGKR